MTSLLRDKLAQLAHAAHLQGQYEERLDQYAGTSDEAEIREQIEHYRLWANSLIDQISILYERK
jgi:hypothetical protein